MNRIFAGMPPVVKNLIIINVIMLLLMYMGKAIWGIDLNSILGMYFPKSEHFRSWQVVTHMFMHGGFVHLLFNMFALWMFAGDLEQLWGTKTFVRFYLLSGLGAGVFIALMNWYLSVRMPAYAGAPTLGASGALYALLLAYGFLWPDREVLVWFLFPVRMKYVLLFFGLFEFFGTLNSTAGVQGNISHIGHLGGLLTGFILLKASILRRKRKSPSLYGAKKVSYFSKLFRSFRLRKKRNVINTRIRAKETIDILLDKIAHQGMASLTPQEKKDLEWARKNYYPSDDETIH